MKFTATLWCVTGIIPQEKNPVPRIDFPVKKAVFESERSLISLKWEFRAFCSAWVSDSQNYRAYLFNCSTIPESRPVHAHSVRRSSLSSWPSRMVGLLFAKEAAHALNQFNYLRISHKSSYCAFLKLFSLLTLLRVLPAHRYALLCCQSYKFQRATNNLCVHSNLKWKKLFII